MQMLTMENIDRFLLDFRKGEQWVKGLRLEVTVVRCLSPTTWVFNGLTSAVKQMLAFFVKSSKSFNVEVIFSNRESNFYWKKLSLELLFKLFCVRSVLFMLFKALFIYQIVASGFLASDNS